MTDVGALLASYDARIAEARNRRLGLQGRAPIASKPKTSPSATFNRDWRAEPLTSAQKAIVRMLLEHPMATTEVASAAVITTKTAQVHLSFIKARLAYAGVEMEDTRAAGGRGALRIIDRERARAML